MRGLCIDGPNKGTIVQMRGLPRESNIFRIIDPSERAISYKIDEYDPLTPIKVNTYYRMPAPPVAQAFGFDALYRFRY